MFRVFDNKYKCWIKNIYVNPNEELFILKKMLFGITKLCPLSNKEYIIHKNIDLLDNKGKLIYEGDIVKVITPDNREFIGMIAFANELSAYVILRYDADEFYYLGSQASGYISVIGNILEHKDLFMVDNMENNDGKDNQQTL